MAVPDSKELLFSILIIALATCISIYSISQDNKLIKQEPSLAQYELRSFKIQTLQGLKGATKYCNGVGLNKVAVGYNTNLDVIVRAIDTFDKIILNNSNDNENKLEIPKLKEIEALTQRSLPPAILSPRQLLRSFAFFFSRGSAAERFVADEVFFDKTIAEILVKSKSKEADYEITKYVGGNAALMAQQFASVGVEVLLGGGAIGDDLNALLHPTIHTIRPDQNKKDEIHLIMEYAKNEVWKNDNDSDELKAPRANRFIISHDKTNANLTYAKLLHDNLIKFDADVVVIAGVHLCEGLETSEERVSKLKEISSFIQDRKTHPLNQPIHLEVASTGDSDFLIDLINEMLVLVDSIGLNEQELGTIYRATGATEIPLSAFVAPTLEQAMTAISHVFQWCDNRIAQLQKGNSNQNLRYLNRIHLHFLAYHIIAQRNYKTGYEKQATEVYRWQRERAVSAVSAGSLACTSQACGADFTLDDVVLQPDTFKVRDEATNQMKRARIISSSAIVFTRNNFDFFVAPVLVCKNPAHTVGLGDTISSTALSYHYSLDICTYFGEIIKS